MSNLGLPTQQRDWVKVASPPWLATGDAEKYLYTMGLCSDLLLEKANQAAKIGMPGQGDASQIPFLANDRLLLQGPGESNAEFVARLKAAFQAWKLAGSRRAVLQQLQAYMQNLQPGVAAALPEMLIVGGNYASGVVPPGSAPPGISEPSTSVWDTLYIGNALGAVPTKATIQPANWNWDGASKPWRAWLVIFLSSVSTGLFGTGISVASIGGSGVAGVTSGFATLTGLTGLTSAQVNQFISLNFASHSANNGFFQIVSVLSPTSCIIANTAAVSGDTGLSYGIWAYPWIAPAPVWGAPGFTWGGAGSWGLSCTPDVVQSIRLILSRWKSAGTYYPHIIFCFGGGDSTAGKEFSPNSAQGAGNPDGTWGGYAKNVNGVMVPAKSVLNQFDCFADGTGLYNQCSVHNMT